MWSTKDIVIFLAGAEAFHTLSHIIINFTDSLPIKVFGIEWTSHYNLYAIVINAVITGVLLWWAQQKTR